jgi:predicted CXXCH cytochrome family protein
MTVAIPLVGCIIGCAQEPFQPSKAGLSEYAGSQSCKECHDKEFRDWSVSVHAKAERTVDPELDRAAFQVAEASVGESSKTFFIGAEGPEGATKEFHPTRVIGETPLRQFMIPFEGGKLQVASLTFGTEKGEWYEVFGDENRRPDEWGHWTGRGMNWNSMCAECHNTSLFKNYDLASDTYSTTCEEMAVGCEACHGPGQAHVDWQREFHLYGADPIANPTGKLLIDTCGVCHARRTPLTEDFLPGDLFLDHYVPELPNETEVYYPDGQVHDENYVYTSFRMSRMYKEGVHCLDCHDPHGAGLIDTGNALCMRCHVDTIDPTLHSHHRIDQPGGQCVNCHMPITVYMQRQPRRDHGFTIPDPELTIEEGVPNACNRCHDDKGPEWAAEAMKEWYPEKKDRPWKKRSRTVARARRYEPEVVTDLIALTKFDPHPAWRAIGAGLLDAWIEDPEARGAALSLLTEEDPLIRTMAVESLELAGAQVQSQIRPLLTDPVRSVRVRAAWNLRESLESGSPELLELVDVLKLNADQPPGALQLAGLLEARGQLPQAIALLKRATSWESQSDLLWQALATAQSQAGQDTQAVETLRTAAQRLPNSAHIQYSLGLAYAASGDLGKTVVALEKACALDSQFARSWYNLGLAYHQSNRPEEAFKALRKSSVLEPRNAHYAYTIATVCRDLGRIDDARYFAARTLEIEPQHPGSLALLAQLGGKQPRN